MHHGSTARTMLWPRWRGPFSTNAGLKRSRTRTISHFGRNEPRQHCNQAERWMRASEGKAEATQSSPPHRRGLCNPPLSLYLSLSGLTPCTPRPKAPAKTGPLTPPRRAQGQLLPQPPPLPKLPESSCWCFAPLARYELCASLRPLCGRARSLHPQSPGFPRHPEPEHGLNLGTQIDKAPRAGPRQHTGHL